MAKTLGERKMVCTFHDIVKLWECRTEIIFLHDSNIRIIDSSRKTEEWQGSSLHILLFYGDIQKNSKCSAASQSPELTTKS